MTFNFVFKRVLKKSVSQDFRPPIFFHDLNPSGPLIKRLKYFGIRFQFCQDIQIFKKLCGVHPTAESELAVCIIPQSRAPGCAFYHGVNFRGVQNTAESKYTLRSQNQNLYESLGAFKGTIEEILLDVNNSIM